MTENQIKILAFLVVVSMLANIVFGNVLPLLLAAFAMVILAIDWIKKELKKK